MSAENRVTIFVVKRKRGRKGQTIFIVKYMQNRCPDEFTVEELTKQLAGSLYTTKFNVAFAMAHNICNDIISTEYGVCICKKYKNVYVSTNKLSEPEEAKIAELPCLKDDLYDFEARLEFFANAQGGYTAINDTMSSEHVFFKLLRLKQNEHTQKYWMNKAYISMKEHFLFWIEKYNSELVKLEKMKQIYEEKLVITTANLAKLEDSCYDENYWINELPKLLAENKPVDESGKVIF